MWLKRAKERPVVSVISAVSLVETLVSLSIASFLLLVASSFYADHYYSQNKQKALFSLQQHTHHLLDYLQQHIQKINYQGSLRENNNYALFQFHHKSYRLSSEHCLLFISDLNNDGCVGTRSHSSACQNQGVNNTRYIAKEIFGVKFEDNSLYLYNDNKLQKCHQTECQILATECKQGRWDRVAHLGEYSVEQFKLSWLKAESLMKIELRLKSIEQPNISYGATAYSYILNSGGEGK
ncbi:hypothetical protein A1D22_08430 [Pasteurellaceae bacterium LFhippo2]|nr:hypothetical protein [Pasteurellaceae bacterium LFhippo2]